MAHDAQGAKETEGFRIRWRSMKWLMKQHGLWDCSGCLKDISLFLPLPHFPTDGISLFSQEKDLYVAFFFFLKSIALKENVSLRHTCFPARHKTLGSKHGRLVFEEEEDTNEEARTLPGITTLGNSAGQHCWKAENHKKWQTVQVLVAFLPCPHLSMVVPLVLPSPYLPPKPG